MTLYELILYKYIQVILQQEMLELCCHFDALHLLQIGIDIYEQILGLHRNSLEPMDEFEF